MEIKQLEKIYNTDKDCVFSCNYHVIFCPKYRRAVLNDKIADRLKQLIYDKQKEYRYKVLDIEVMPEHVHMILDVNPKADGIYRVISKIKGYTAHELRKEFKELRSRLPTLWTNSRFISSVGAVTLDVVKKYIENQKNK
jgi:putative transposase